MGNQIGVGKESGNVTKFFLQFNSTIQCYKLSPFKHSLPQCYIICGKLIFHMILDIYIVANEDEKQFALKLHR